MVADRIPVTGDGRWPGPPRRSFWGIAIILLGGIEFAIIFIGNAGIATDNMRMFLILFDCLFSSLFSIFHFLILFMCVFQHFVLIRNTKKIKKLKNRKNEKTLKDKQKNGRQIEAILRRFSALWEEITRKKHCYITRNRGPDLTEKGR